MGSWLLWLGGIFCESTMLKSDAISPAANRWQAGLIKAINGHNLPVTLLSHFPEPLWPKGKYRPGNPDDLDPYFDGRLVHYWNIPLLRSFSLSRVYIQALQQIIKIQGKPLAVFSYNPTPHAVATGLYSQKRYQIPWIDVCADHYDPGSDWSKYSSGASLAKGHVFLSYHAFKDCPYLKKLHLDGGISNFNFDLEPQIIKKPKNKKIVLYTGMMSIWGGVSFLLKAFEKVNDPDIELWICGHGNNSDLENAIKSDSRIHFFGLVSEVRLNEMCLQASVFVNPRPSFVHGNKMNFPSKILKYLSYGKPVITTWTPGISPEYRSVLEVLTEETEDCLAKTIETVLHWSDKQRIENLLKNREFILKSKTWEYQAYRLEKWLKDDIL